MSFRQGIREALDAWEELPRRPHSAATEFLKGQKIRSLRDLERSVKARGISVNRHHCLPDTHPSFVMKMSGQFLITLKRGSEWFEFYGLAHELGHVLLDGAGCLTDQSSNDPELEAHLFAILLLFHSGGLQQGFEENRDAQIVATTLTLVTFALLSLYGAIRIWDWFRNHVELYEGPAGQATTI